MKGEKRDRRVAHSRPGWLRRQLRFIRKRWGKHRSYRELWKHAKQAKTSCERARRFHALETWARLHRDDLKKGTARREKWERKREVYHGRRAHYEAECKEHHEHEQEEQDEWPADIALAELLYHNPPHLHVASCEREKLIAVCRCLQREFGVYISEFPPFNTVDPVHVNCSYHYRASSSCGTCRSYYNRGDGCAADINGTREYSAYVELVRRYR